MAKNWVLMEPSCSKGPAPSHHFPWMEVWFILTWCSWLFWETCYLGCVLSNGWVLRAASEIALIPCQLGSQHAWLQFCCTVQKVSLLYVSEAWSGLAGHEGSTCRALGVPVQSWTQPRRPVLLQGNLWGAGVMSKRTCLITLRRHWLTQRLGMRQEQQRRPNGCWGWVSSSPAAAPAWQRTSWSCAPGCHPRRSTAPGL